MGKRYDVIVKVVEWEVGSEARRPIFHSTLHFPDQTTAEEMAHDIADQAMVKALALHDVHQSHQSCPECGNPSTDKGCMSLTCDLGVREV